VYGAPLPKRLYLDRSTMRAENKPGNEETWHPAFEAFQIAQAVPAAGPKVTVIVCRFAVTSGH